MYRITFLAITLCLSACSSIPEKTSTVSTKTISPADESHIFVALLPGAKVEFQGELPRNIADKNNAPIMYPGYSAGSFVAGIIVHSLMQQGIETAEQLRSEKLKNEILEKYQVLLTNVSLETLLENNIETTINNRIITLHPASQHQTGNNGYLLHVKPVYSFIQNERSITLYNQLSLSESDRPKAGIKTSKIEYISSLTQENIALDTLGEKELKNIKDILKDSFIKSLELGLRYIDEPLLTSNKPTTLRYTEGGQKQVERGHLLHQNCERMLFVSLRNIIKSVPIYNPEKDCQQG